MVSQNSYGSFYATKIACLILVVCLTGCPKKSSKSPSVAEQATPTDGDRKQGDKEAVASPGTKTTAMETTTEGTPNKGADVAQELDVAVGDRAVELSTSDDDRSSVGPVAWQPEGSWTTRKLVVLSPGGPTAIALSISVGGMSLNEASEAMLSQVAAGLVQGLVQGDGEVLSWAELLQQPLVQSGWLGNLVADEEQEEQLIAMYDSNKDAAVDAEELPAFLSRGLSRTDAIQLTDAGNAPDADIDASPWGTMDRNNDYSMDATEIAGLQSAMMKFDLNGDAVVTTQELLDTSSNPMAQTMTRSMLDIKSVVFIEADLTPQQARSRALSILRHYTFLESIAREEWNHWTDDLWAAIDSDGDQQIDTRELQGIFESEPSRRIFVQLPGLEVTGPLEMHCLLSEDSEGIWASNASGGHLVLPGCSLLVEMNDTFSAAGKSLLRNRIEMALSNAQLRSFFTNQLQLSDGAFELADPDQNLKLDEQEFARVWSWLQVRQGARMVGRWMVSGKPWFQLADSNGDGRLTEYELASLGERILELDSNADGRITPHEMPLLSRFQLARTDNRIAQGPFDVPSETNEPDADWFSAMDTNRDGVLSRSEFLGSRQDFSAVDKDKDGFVSRVEVVIVP